MKERKSSFVDFKAIKDQFSIAQVLDHYGITPSLSKSGDGDRLSGACPLHGGTNRTHFRASLSKNCWNCFGGCPGGGNILDFVSRKENLPLREAALLIQEWFPVVSDGACTPTSAKATANQKQSSQQPDAEKEEDVPLENMPLVFELNHLDSKHPYLLERGLSDETIATFGLGYCSKGLLTGRIAIPVHNGESQLVAYAGRWPGDPPNGTPKYKLPGGFRKSLELFNLHRALSAALDTPLVIVEGFFDCMALWQTGVRRVVALMGSTLSVEQEILIKQICDSQSRIVIMLDEDAAGRTGRDDIARRFASITFVKIHCFESEGQQPEQLDINKLRAAGLR